MAKAKRMTASELNKAWEDYIKIQEAITKSQRWYQEAQTKVEAMRNGKNDR